VEKHFLSIGSAGAALPFVRDAWMKISGECPATPLPGSVLIAAGGTASAINDFSLNFLPLYSKKK